MNLLTAIVVSREVIKIDTTAFCNSINIPKADFIEKLNSAINILNIVKVFSKKNR